MAEDKPRLPPLTPPRNLTGELVQHLTEEITSGRFVPNEQLSTEQDQPCWYIFAPPRGRFLLRR